MLRRCGRFIGCCLSFFHGATFGSSSSFFRRFESRQHCLQQQAVAPASTNIVPTRAANSKFVTHLGNTYFGFGFTWLGSKLISVTQDDMNFQQLILLF